MRNLLILLAVLSLTGCQDKLNRKKAEKLILESMDFPLYEKCKLPTNLYEILRGKKNGAWNNNKELMFELEEGGLIEINTFDGFIGNIYKYREINHYISLTDSGQTYFVNNINNAVMVNCIAHQFIGVTGITFEGDDYAYANYDVYREPYNLFSKLAYDRLEDTLHLYADFKLFDDGWRLTDTNHFLK